MNEKLSNKKVEKRIVSFLKDQGFVNQSAEIYNGFSKFWDFGVNGSLVKNNLRRLWLSFFVDSEEKNFLVENPIITHEKVLEASGHKKNFNDWIVICNFCKGRFRVDKILNEKETEKFLSFEKREKENFKLEKKCPKCENKLGKPKEFNLMLKTSINSEEKNSEEQSVYLRPETCQGIFINFKENERTTGKGLPFGVCQIGKSFRNEVTLNHGIFRMREFEQAEMEFFVREEEKDIWWKYWVRKAEDFFKKLILEKSNTNFFSKREIPKSELPHYSAKTLDLYFKYQFGWGEISSISDRGDFDLKNHSEKSSVYLGIKNKEKSFFPHVLEISFGIERLMLAILENSYKEEIIEKNGMKRKYLKIHPLISPYLVSVMPLSKSLKEKSKIVYKNLIKTGLFSVSYEETGNIGNRYRRQDSIGTKFCITIDFETEKSECVTLRERDSMKQISLKIEELEKYLVDFMIKEKKTFAESRGFS